MKEGRKDERRKKGMREGEGRTIKEGRKEGRKEGGNDSKKVYR